MNARTTTSLVKRAVNAATEAGITVGAVEVQQGGVVRVLAIEAVSNNPTPKTGKSCDDIFGASD